MICAARRPDRGTRNRLPYPEVQILMDGIDSNTSLIAAGYFNGIVQNYLFWTSCPPRLVPWSQTPPPYPLQSGPAQHSLHGARPGGHAADDPARSSCRP